ncbi:hypothetical protein BDK51DRAFT_46443 [Blyttiomyces helicus]|uniref:C2H2-type domain-containing protein n=1 Tax=Blyttiomyces helicus TaxID=388810 RepID=A0A4P9WN24_9FUNG|nr:hypothetical protein BDK51DRAFT_46443 [Blyttiomyces helicus]|eukprot:RKO92610.1 hypothetical protein BDK51DRAFT_46443 [Blyttiomyces helicus]
MASGHHTTRGCGNGWTGAEEYGPESDGPTESWTRRHRFLKTQFFRYPAAVIVIRKLTSTQASEGHSLGIHIRRSTFAASPAAELGIPGPGKLAAGGCGGPASPLTLAMSGPISFLVLERSPILRRDVPGGVADCRNLPNVYLNAAPGIFKRSAEGAAVWPADPGLASMWPGLPTTCRKGPPRGLEGKRRSRAINPGLSPTPGKAHPPRERPLAWSVPPSLLKALVPDGPPPPSSTQREGFSEQSKLQTQASGAALVDASRCAIMWLVAILTRADLLSSYQGESFTTLNNNMESFAHERPTWTGLDPRSWRPTPTIPYYAAPPHAYQEYVATRDGSYPVPCGPPQHRNSMTAGEHYEMMQYNEVVDGNGGGQAGGSGLPASPRAFARFRPALGGPHGAYIYLPPPRAGAPSTTNSTTAGSDAAPPAQLPSLFGNDPRAVYASNGMTHAAATAATTSSVARAGYGEWTAWARPRPTSPNAAPPQSASQQDSQGAAAAEEPGRTAAQASEQAAAATDQGATTGGQTRASGSVVTKTEERDRSGSPAQSTAGTPPAPAAPAPPPASASSGKPKTFVCQMPGCGKSFSTSGHLTRHTRVHAGLKPYACPIPGCQSKFGRRDNMIQHFRIHAAKVSWKPHTPPTAVPAPFAYIRGPLRRPGGPEDPAEAYRYTAPAPSAEDAARARYMPTGRPVDLDMMVRPQRTIGRWSFKDGVTAQSKPKASDARSDPSAEDVARTRYIPAGRPVEQDMIVGMGRRPLFPDGRRRRLSWNRSLAFGSLGRPGSGPPDDSAEASDPSAEETARARHIATGRPSSRTWIWKGITLVLELFKRRRGGNKNKSAIVSFMVQSCRTPPYVGLVESVAAAIEILGAMVSTCSLFEFGHPQIVTNNLCLKGTIATGGPVELCAEEVVHSKTGLEGSGSSTESAEMRGVGTCSASKRRAWKGRADIYHSRHVILYRLEKKGDPFRDVLAVAPKSN